MRGRPGCPTEQKKHSVGATGGSPLFSTRKGWVQGRPLIRPGFAGPPSPRGEGFEGGCVPFRLQHPPLPARPAGGRAVTGVGLWAAGQAKKEGGPPQGPPNQSRESRGEKLSPLALFLPISREKWGPRRAGGPPGALRPEASKKPRPPEGYAVPPPAPTAGPFFAQIP